MHLAIFSSTLAGGIFANGAAYAAFSSILSEGAQSLNRPGPTPESKLPLSQRQSGAQKEIDALTTDGTLNTGKVFTGKNAVGDAATEVLGSVHPISEKYNLEIGGTIVTNGNGASYSSPIVGGSRSVRVDGAGALAGYHTHPGGDSAGSVFSNRYNSKGPGDVGFTQRYKIPLYMSHQPTGGSINYNVCNYNATTCSPNFNPRKLPGFNYGVQGRSVQ
ncbi:MAG: hypothetical protein JKY66_05170 [Spongiibacteraceae bacterium]|nr:hypothetical protein [Spongiibacteraceae bacterium]